MNITFCMILELLLHLRKNLLIILKIFINSSIVHGDTGAKSLNFEYQCIFHILVLFDEII